MGLIFWTTLLIKFSHLSLFYGFDSKLPATCIDRLSDEDATQDEVELYHGCAVNKNMTIIPAFYNEMCPCSKHNQISTAAECMQTRN